MCREAPKVVYELEHFGMPFDRNPDGTIYQRPFGGHTANYGEKPVQRACAAADRTGHALLHTLYQQNVRAHTQFFVEWMALDLIRDAEGDVVGVTALEMETGDLHVLHAKTVLLATGGAGRFFSLTTSDRSATGEGLEMALAIGARAAALEFVQFHPTALRVQSDPAPLLTEALRGAGARLVTSTGRPLMAGRHALGDLAPLDVVARAVWERTRAGEPVLLDATQVFSSGAADAFPGARRTALWHGIDPAATPLPVVAAAHYHMGGLAVDECGRTSVRGLWACGEVSSTGAHGANRLASNSLLEAVVFGDRVARDIAVSLPALPAPRPVPALDRPERPDREGAAEVRRIMSRHVGVLRDEEGLREALRGLCRLRARALAEGSADLRNRTEAALLIAASALRRRESRGGHFRTAHPQPDPAQARRSDITLDEALRTARDVAQCEAA
jgi:aspartate oxidase